MLRGCPYARIINRLQLANPILANLGRIHASGGGLDGDALPLAVLYFPFV